MTAAIPLKGMNAYLAFGTSGTENNLSTYLQDITPDRGASKEDATTMGSAGWENSVSTIKNATFGLAGVCNAALHAILAPLLAVDGKSVVFGMEGNGSGKPRETGEAYLSKYSRKTNAKGIWTFDAEITVNGAVTDDTFPA